MCFLICEFYVVLTLPSGRTSTNKINHDNVAHALIVSVSDIQCIAFVMERNIEYTHFTRTDTDNIVSRFALGMSKL